MSKKIIAEECRNKTGNTLYIKANGKITIRKPKPFAYATLTVGTVKDGKIVTMDITPHRKKVEDILYD